MLNIDNHVIIDENNWFAKEYNKILNETINLVTDENKIMFLFSGGMGAKVLICDLHKRYPNGIFIDLGSALHLLFTKESIRAVSGTYDEYFKYFESIIN